MTLKVSFDEIVCVVSSYLVWSSVANSTIVVNSSYASARTMRPVPDPSVSLLVAPGIGIELICVDKFLL